MSATRAARRRAERAAKKQKKKDDVLLDLMSRVHIGLGRSTHPKRGQLLQLSRDMIALYHGIEDDHG